MNLDEFERLDRERTPGEWVSVWSPEWDEDNGGPMGWWIYRKGMNWEIADVGRFRERAKEDAEFIAACSIMVPLLIDVVRAAKREAGSSFHYHDLDHAPCSLCDTSPPSSPSTRMDEARATDRDADNISSGRGLLSGDVDALLAEQWDTDQIRKKPSAAGFHIDALHAALRAMRERETPCPDCGIPRYWCERVTSHPAHCWRWDYEQFEESGLSETAP